MHGERALRLLLSVSVGGGETSGVCVLDYCNSSATPQKHQQWLLGHSCTQHSCMQPISNKQLLTDSHGVAVAG